MANTGSLASLALFFFLSWTPALSLAEGVLSCSGYVHSAFPLDYSRVEVALFTEHGSKRDSTDCAPSSGYFFLPVEEGKYVLKAVAPPGWVLEPAQVDLVVDGETDPCSRHEDFNFEFRGFSVFGSVRRSEKDDSGGLDKIVLTVSDEKDGGKVVQTAASDEEGKFSFPGLPPGSYAVRLSDESLQSYSFKEKEKKLVVADGSVDLGPFIIVGYDLEGVVTDADGAVPVAGVRVHLAQAGKAVATVETDASGKYQFANVSRGSYAVKAEATTGVALDVNEHEAKVFDKNVVVKPFRVVSFDLAGFVQLAPGRPAPAGVKIKIGQKGKEVQTVTTDEKGRFVVKSGCVCDLSLQAEMDEARFERVSLKSVAPGSELPVLTPVEFRVSGFVEGADRISPDSLKVVFNRKGDKTPAASASVGASGTFSAFLPPGGYAAEIRNDGVREKVFTPSVPSFQVKSEAVAGVDFKVSRFDVSGSLKCFSRPCNSGVVLLLKGEQQAESEAAVASVEADGKFSFGETRFGQYTLILKDEGRCWESNQMSVKVDRDRDDLAVAQKGSVMTVHSTHSTKLVLSDAKTSSKQQTFDVTRGDNVVCVDGHGDLRVSANGCYRFRAEPEVVSDKTERLTLAVSSYKVAGAVKSVDSIKDIKVALTSATRERVEELALKKTKAGYEFEFFVEEDESVTVTPSSKEAFFQPAETTLRAKKTCEENVVSFAGKKGLFIEGKVVPAVEGVVVEGGGQKASSRSDGTFRLGPFADETRHPLTVSKEGFSFEEGDAYGVFKSRILSSISIRVADGKGTALPDDAVVSISSGKNFRNSAHLKDGAVRFPNLLPGAEYFVKVFLKEWVFEPKHVVIDLKENVDHAQELVGTRVSYSLFGRVQYPNKKAAPGVVVLAQGSGRCDGQIEDATSSNQGAFRLRGLEPGCKYQLSPGNREAHTFILADDNVTMAEEDLTLAAPIVTQESPDTFHLAVLVKSEKKDRHQANPQQQQQAVTRQVSVEAKQGDKVVSKVFSVEQDRLTVLPALPAAVGKYSVGVSASSVQECPSDGGSLQYLTFVVKEEDSKRKGAVGGGNVYFTFVVAAVVAGAVMYRRTRVEK